MGSIAVLLTCFNRKDKTLRALHSLQTAFAELPQKQAYSVYLTDDGSTDGTADAVISEFPEVHIIKGFGDLFWAEGMRSSWNQALKKKYDYYFLINDDTEFYPFVLNELFSANEFSKDQYNRAAIAVGCTEDKESGRLTYSGSLIINKWLYKLRRLKPNNTFQRVDLANANIMLVPGEVVDQIGILSAGYAHGKADYDYTLKATRKKIPVLISRVYCGHCTFDHRDYYEGFEKLNRKQRKKLLYHPTQLDTHSHLLFMRRFFPLRAPFVAFFAWFKVNFPKIYLAFFRNR